MSAVALVLFLSSVMPSSMQRAAMGARSAVRAPF